MKIKNNITEKYIYKGEKDIYEQLRYFAASKLNVYAEHQAGKGSYYITIGDLKVRFSNHENTSKSYENPDINVVNRNITYDEIEEIKQRIHYPSFSKQRVFGMHVGLTIPKLKKILPNDCFREIAENPMYPNTFTTFIVVDKSLSFLEEIGIVNRIPIRQETYSIEDFDGY
jgi:hypothetical protein